MSFPSLGFDSTDTVLLSSQGWLTYISYSILSSPSSDHSSDSGVIPSKYANFGGSNPYFVHFIWWIGLSLGSWVKWDILTRHTNLPSGNISDIINGPLQGMESLLTCEVMVLK